MLATEENKFWSSGEFFDLGDEFDDSTSIDIHTLMEIIGENPGPAQNTPGSLSTEPVSSVESVPDVFRQVDSPLQNGFQELEVKPSLGASLPAPLAFPSSCSSGDSVSGTWYPDGSFLPPQNFMVIDQGKSDSKLPPEILYPFPNCSDSLRLHDTRYLPGLGTSSNVLSSSRIDGQQRQNEMHGRNTISSAGYANQVLDCSDTVHLDCFSNEVKVLDVNLGKSLVAENNIGVLEAPEKYSCTSMEIRIMDKNISGQHATHIQSSFSQSPDSMFQNCHSDMHYSIGDGDNHVADPSTEHFCDGVNDQFVPNCEDNMINIEDDEYVTENPSMQVEAASPIVDLSEIDYSGMMGSYSKTVFNNDIILSPEMSYSDADGEMIGKKELKKLWVDPQSCCKQTTCRKEASISGLTESIPDTLDSLFPNSNSKMAFSGTFPSTSSKRHVKSDMDEEMNAFVASERAPDSQDILDLTAGVTFNAGDLNQTVLGHLSHGSQGSSQFKQFNFIKDEREGEAKQHKNVANHLSKVSPESIQSNSLDEKTLDVDGDDNDICILEDISQPPRSTAYPYRKIITPQPPTFNDSLHDIGTGSMRLRANDEQLVLRHALQDLSQQKEETSPPDGLLAIPLLRHQKIALSWMVHKEVAGWNCVGGILADDQGLGKTISMIALILKERPPSSVVCCKDARQEKKETLNLDEDDEGIVDIDGLKQDLNSLPVTSKGRPAAGTLVVCPTSVIRQWADELHNKVTAKAGLSVLVYHGGNRTKDPCELAKYDVVLTTYSIVSMEVPKQPLVEKDEDGTQIRNADVLSMGMSSSKKRKYPPSSEKGSSKGRKGVDSRFLDICDRPLGKVQWFRVVLDEAQSIKNYRTQVARACWGLRAKRRWCLSGTPIQNAIDDLYSYFRFLKYEPYSVYKAFCEMIKIPINRSPTKGYRKLQAVLKTVMLRRTKGTKIDGEPIITLPAKSIELKKVDFSAEERDFYSKLEADSRAKFQDYADAGTVKQNYVNILLMLLRLRQACDHPLLVRGLDSDSKWKSSVQSARKLSQEKQLFLLHCLEASLAICGICNDPPEDAVVSICGHVFCNQCICQHLTGDDNYCPAASCKIQLNTSSVFSRASLKCSLSDEAGSDNFCSSGSELVEVPEPCYEACSFDSSKIRAALKVLQSLSSPGESESLVNPLRSSGHIDSFSEKFSDTLSENLLEVKLEKKTLSPDKSDKSSSNTLSVVREKAIVFSQWTGMLNLLEACLKNTSIQYRRLDGTMSVAARDKAVKEFNSCPEVSVMLMSLKAASLGLNLVAACHVLLLDLWWNPTTEDQAIDRAHRIGQTRPVTVVRLTVKDTVEDRILALQQKKREMVSSAFGEDETGSKQTRLTVDDLKYLFMA